MLLGDEPEERRHGAQNPDPILQPVAGVGRDQQRPGGRERREVVVDGIRGPVRVVAAEDDELGHGETVAEVVGIDHPRQPEAALVRGHVLQALLGVVVDLLGVRPPEVALVLDLHRHVEDVKDHGRDADDALRCGDAGEVSRPATLGGTQDHIPAGFPPPLVLSEGVEAVHGADGSLGHGEVDDPVLIACLEVLDPGGRDESVLGETIEERLIGDLEKHGYTPPRQGCKGETEVIVALAKVPLPVLPAHDDEPHHVRELELLRLEDKELMLPRDALPDLGDQVQVVHLPLGLLDDALQVPLEGVVRFGEIAEEVRVSPERQGKGGCDRCEAADGGPR